VPIRHLRVLVLMLMMPTSQQTTVAAQESNSATQMEALQACGGVESLRLNLRLTFTNFPDKLAELEGHLDEGIATNSERMLSDLLLVPRYSVSMLGRLGNKTRCNYISRYQSCVAEGYERLANVIPFFNDTNIHELENRSFALVAISQIYSEIQYNYIVESNPPASLQFTGVGAQDKIYVNFIEMPLSDALFLQDQFNGFFCKLSVMSDDEIISSEERIVSFIYSASR
jgi:hypothetical protein